MKRFFFPAALLTTLTLAAPASAQQPTGPVEPAPGQAAAAPPSSAGTPLTATCSLGEHPGVDADEARAAADVVCHELARRGATNTSHEVRFGKLGARTMVTLASRSGNAYDERRTLVSGLDEIDVAGPRLADALTTSKPLEDTRNVDNVLASEARSARLQHGSTAVEASLFGTTGLGAPTGASAGVGLALSYRAGRFGIGMHGRAGGIGSGDDKLASASLDVGGRLYLSTSEIAPFVGTGLGVAYLEINRSTNDLSGSGMLAFGEVGIELLRSHSIAMTTSVRADVPFYELEGFATSAYVTPLSLNLGLMFH